MTPRPSARLRRVEHLLTVAGLEGVIVALRDLGIGMSGLNVRGPKDEDGTHTRVMLSDGRAVVLREYSPNGLMPAYQAKEVAMFALLRAHALPAPRILAQSPGALLLSDEGGEPLDVVFRDVTGSDREALWSAVGTMLGQLHAIPTSSGSFLEREVYQRPWTRFVPYLGRSIASLATARPELATNLRELRSLLPAMRRWHDARPRSVKLAGGGYLPGLLLARDDTRWAGTSWMSLGYYVSIDDPARDLVHAALAHREWLGEDVPGSLFAAYGSRPDATTTLLYETASRLARAKGHGRPERSRVPGPPHTTVARVIDHLPDVVEQLRTALL